MNFFPQVEQGNDKNPSLPRDWGKHLCNLVLPGVDNHIGDNSLLDSAHHCSKPETTPESVPSKQTERSRSPPRCFPRCERQHNQDSQSNARESFSHSLPSGKKIGKTGYDSPQQEWKIPFIGQDPKTAKVYFIDISKYATNLNTTILCKRHLWHQCPFNHYHLIKSSKKFVTHIQRCIHQSLNGNNGKQSLKEVKKWHVCEHNSNHLVHEDYKIRHYLENCVDLKKKLTLACDNSIIQQK